MRGSETIVGVPFIKLQFANGLAHIISTRANGKTYALRPDERRLTDVRRVDEHAHGELGEV